MARHSRVPPRLPHVPSRLPLRSSPCSDPATCVCEGTHARPMRARLMQLFSRGGVRGGVACSGSWGVPGFARELPIRAANNEKAVPIRHGSSQKRYIQEPGRRLCGLFFLASATPLRRRRRVEATGTDSGSTAGAGCSAVCPSLEMTLNRIISPVVRMKCRSTPCRAAAAFNRLRMVNRFSFGSRTASP
jgi:hypothetical protein